MFETEFAYAPDTKTITLPTDVFHAGDTVIVDYYPKFSEYEEIANDANISPRKTGQASALDKSYFLRIQRFLLSPTQALVRDSISMLCTAA